MRPPEWNSLANAVNDANYQKRLQAKDRLTTQCSGLTGQQVLEFSTPLADDENGLKYRDAHSTVTDTYKKSSAQIMAALEELAAQGHLAEAGGLLTGNARWQGESWRNSREIYSAAFDIAALRSSSSPELAADDARLHARCLRSGICEGGYDYVPPSFSAEDKQKILALAAEMEQALRKGDVAAFVKKR